MMHVLGMYCEVFKILIDMSKSIIKYYFKRFKKGSK